MNYNRQKGKSLSLLRQALNTNKIIVVLNRKRLDAMVNLFTHSQLAEFAPDGEKIVVTNLPQITTVDDVYRYTNGRHPDSFLFDEIDTLLEFVSKQFGIKVESLAMTVPIQDPCTIAQKTDDKEPE